jgi:NADPH:quinone reductase-like Zn-dependent oxidoreductase
MSLVYEIEAGGGLESLKIVERPVPQPARGQVLVRLRAASLNFRDLLIARGFALLGPSRTLVPMSDAAGEVIALGQDCNRFSVGDRVAGLFMPSWTAGDITDADMASSLGSSVDGVLRQYRVYEETGLVRIPSHLSFEQAATLPCAAVTAWNALHGFRPLLPGHTILTLGTGGVSLFALQFAKAAGARVIITSSSDEKLAKVKALGADFGVNYKTTPEWGAEVRRLTDGRGVDLVVETSGAGTLPQSIAATRRDGSIHLIGVLTAGQLDPVSILAAGVIVRGLTVGSGDMFNAMNRAIEVGGIEPNIDKIFDFNDAPAAFAHLQAANHLGKIVIRIQ